MRVYLDYNATTPTDPRVRTAMDGCAFGNPSSRDHSWGWDASVCVEHARGEVVQSAGRHAADVLFGSGATEALNVVLRGWSQRATGSKIRVVTSAVDHEAILGPSRYLQKTGRVDLEILPVDSRGHGDVEVLRAALEGQSQALVALGLANSEIGTLAFYDDIAAVVRAAQGLMLWDTTQAWGRVPLALTGRHADFVTISAHKCYGPMGVGALITHLEEAEIEPLILGGGQERGRRGGTLNVPGIVGLGAACRLLQEQGDADIARMQTLRDHLEAGIESQLDDIWINGDRANRLCNTSNIGFKGVDARTLIRDMHDIAVSTKSACSSGDSRPSHVLKAIGLSDEDAFSCIRFSLGRFTTQDEIDYTINKVVTSVHKLRRLKSVRV
jgi:cysteine desulfurase